MPEPSSGPLVGLVLAVMVLAGLAAVIAWVARSEERDRLARRCREQERVIGDLRRRLADAVEQPVQDRLVRALRHVEFLEAENQALLGERDEEREKLADFIQAHPRLFRKIGGAE